MTTLPAWERLAPLDTRTPAQIMADVRDQHQLAEEAEKRVALWPSPEKYAEPTGDLPPAIKRWTKFCDRWRATTARGPTGTNVWPGWRMADSYVLRGEKGQRRFVALWIEGPTPTKSGAKSFKLQFAYAHGVNGRLSTEQLEHYLTSDDGIPWLPGVGFLMRQTTR